MNNNSNIEELIEDEWFDDLLFCEDNTWTLGDGTGNGDSNGLLDCYMNNPNWNEDPNDNVDYDGDNDIDIWDDYEYIQNCDDIAVLGQIADIDFVKEEGTGTTNVLHLEKEELNDNSGNWIAPTFALPAGLYWIGFDVEGAGYISFYREVKGSLTNTSNLATQLDVTVFPVPIEDDSFNLHLKANANLSCQYQLLSGTGAVLHTEPYKFAQGYEEDLHITSTNPIPEGIVLHKFTFNDGSIKTITTVRSN